MRVCTCFVLRWGCVGCYNYRNAVIFVNPVCMAMVLLIGWNEELTASSAPRHSLWAVVILRSTTWWRMWGIHSEISWWSFLRACVLLQWAHLGSTSCAVLSAEKDLHSNPGLIFDLWICFYEVYACACPRRASAVSKRAFGNHMLRKYWLSCSRSEVPLLSQRCRPSERKVYPCNVLEEMMSDRCKAGLLVCDPAWDLSCSIGA